AATVILAASFLGIGSWASYHAALRNDQYQLIQLGQCVYNGGRLYVDCWENKPPGVAWLNVLGLAMSGGDPVGPWLLPGVAAAATLALLWVAATGLFSVRTGRRIVLIAALVYALRIYDTPSINPDFYASAFELAAVSLWLFGFVGGDVPATRSRVTTIYLLGGGLMWSAATACKQVACIGLIALTLVAFALAATRHTEGRRWLRGLAATWVGFTIGIGAAAVVLAYQHTLGEAWAAMVTFNIGFADGTALITALGGGRIQADLAPLAAFLWLALLGGGVTLYAGRAHRMARPWVFSLMLWWFAAVAFALWGPSGSMRYWQATFPPMFWLAAAGVYHIQQAQERLEGTRRLTFIAVIVTALVMLMRPTLDEAGVGLASSYAASVEQPDERGRLVEISRGVRALVPPGERVYVWGYHAGVYVYSDRLPASRFTYPRSHEQMDEILTDLEVGKAYLLLIPKHRVPEFAHFCDQACHQKLDGVLSGYTSLEPIGPYGVWVRTAKEKSGITPSSP
ncbi:MAG: hypothetical protein Q7R41_00300, partial [Phycisphaerales bacterium]|nr:hypothetical protein [Phycisphaerales bacterium]